MKIKYPALLLAIASTSTFASDIFINEFHYDNSGTDTGEFIEVVAPENTDLSAYTLVLYNGSNGQAYSTTSLGVVASLGNGYGAFSVSYPSNGIQNGSPDGIALVDGDGAVVQFLSYEGAFTASNGPAMGLESDDIGVAQEWSTAVGSSLQLTGEGTVYTDFSWQITESNTQDATNTGQTFASDVTPFINEIHYDNSGSDEGEFVEIAARAGTDLSGYSLEFYNGNGGGLYGSLNLSGVIADQQGGLGTIAFAYAGIQNGSPDGIALISPAGEVVQFISYEGQFTATNGAAAGMESSDILVSEEYNSPVGYSLQLGGQGASYADFAWQTSNQATANAVNMNQTFGNGNDGGDGDGEHSDELGQCGATATLISSIQGSGLATTMSNSAVVAEAVITVRAPAMSGFFMQEEAADDDNNAATSEGIFVYAPELVESVREGDIIRLAATAKEFYDKTQLTDVTDHILCGEANITPTVVSLPQDSTASFEAYEGMLVTNEQDWVISSNYNYNRYAELVASTTRLYNPTQLYLPGSEEAIALANANQLNQILVDDLANGSNADFYLPAGEFGPFNPVRAGQTLTGVTGVVDHDFGAYRIRVSQDPALVDTNSREANPALASGNLKVASFNVLNLFNGDGTGAGFPTSRGADSASEYQRQLTKIVNAVTRIDADIVGLMEIENDGFGANSAIAQLVDALNAEYGETMYAFIDLGGPVGTDEITVGIIYKPAVVEPVEAAQILTEANSPSDEQGVLFDTSRNRPSVAQLFKHSDSRQEFVIDVNHFKSKGSGCGAGDDDYATGQGNCNLTRTRAARGVSQWLASEYPQTPAILMGDLNSYAKEDPIRALADAGFTDTAGSIIGDTAYSYTFGGESGTLDYLMTNTDAKEWLVDATEWHINTDESVAFDYNEEYKPDDWLNTLVYRASDHDPVIASFSLPDARLPGDVDWDGDVDIDDMRALLLAIVLRRDVEEAFDLNNDGQINMKDVWALRGLCTRKGCRRA